MTRVLRSLLVVAVASGCPSESKPDGGDFDVVASGTRLRAIGLPGVPSAFFDTTLNITCAFVRDSVFGFRCLPATIVSVAAYEDANCTRPLLSTTACRQETDSVVSVEHTARCVGVSRRAPYRVGATVTLATTYNLEFGRCVTQAAAPAEYVRIEAIDEGMFQPATARAFGSAPVGPQVLVSDDGAKVLLGGYSFADQTSCSVMPLGDLERDNPQYCIAGDLSYDYGDLVEHGNCTTSLGYSVGAAGCGPALYVMRFRSEGGNTYSSRLFTAAAEVDAGAVDNGDVLAGTCGTPVTGGVSRYWRAGTAASLPVAVHAGVYGVGAAKPEFYLSPEGLPLEPTSKWFNTATGEPCYPFATSDAGTRCVPTNQTTVFWADAECTKPLAYAGDAGTYGYVFSGERCAPATLRAAYEFGEAMTTPGQVYVFQGDCHLAGSTAPTGPARSGTLVPWSTFPEVIVNR